MLPTHIDRYYGLATRISRKPPQFPFAENGDLFTKQYSARFMQDLGYFAPRFGARTTWVNRALQSSAFGTTPWAVTGAPTRTGAAYSVDGIVLDLLADGAGNAANYYSAAVTLVTSGVHTFSIVVQRGTVPGKSAVQLYDSTAAALRLSATVDFASTSPVVAVATGALVGSPVALASGVWRLSFTTTSLTAANVHAIRVQPSATGAAAANVYAGAVQLVLGSLPGPIIETTTEARTVSAPDLDDDAVEPDPRMYLMGETAPELFQGRLASFNRTFSRIPPTQIEPSWVYLTKPTLPFQQQDQVVGDYYVNRPNAAKESYDAYEQIAIVGDSGAPGYSPTGGTYTLTVGADTTGAIAYNASAGTVQTALNALASVIALGGVVVTGTYNSPTGYLVTFNSYASATWTSSLTGATVNNYTTPSSYSGGLQYITGQSLGATPISGGTFTITIFGQTTAAIAWNADEATVAAAVNALSNVAAKGGAVIGFPNGTLVHSFVIGLHWASLVSISIAIYRPLISSTNSLTPAGTVITHAPADAPYNVSQAFVAIAATVNIRTISAIAHGISADDTIFLTDGTTYFPGIAGIITVMSADSLQLSIDPSSAYFSIPLFTFIGRRTKAEYKPGTAGIRVLRTTSFYLPGVTPGIDALDDIPLLTNQSDPDSFLQAVFAGSGTVNWQVGEIRRYLGLIFEQVVTTLEAGDI